MYTSSSLSPSLPLSLECASFPNFIASFIADFIEEEEDAFHFIPQTALAVEGFLLTF